MAQTGWWSGPMSVSGKLSLRFRERDHPVHPSFSEGVAKPSNVRGSSHKKHKKHKILVPFVPLVARSRSYSRFCNILCEGGVAAPSRKCCEATFEGADSYALEHWCNGPTIDWSDSKNRSFRIQELSCARFLKIMRLFDKARTF